MRYRGFRAVTSLLLLSFVVSSCGTLAYNRAWEDFEPVLTIDPAEGRWTGEWKSDWNGHSGGLRCMLTRKSADTYFARFYSTYGWFFFFRHEARFLITSETPAAVHFEGQEDLGSLAGGVYRYAGSVSADRFEATFEAENGDHGVFSMTRVK